MNADPIVVIFISSICCGVVALWLAIQPATITGGYAKLTTIILLVLTCVVETAYLYVSSPAAPPWVARFVAWGPALLVGTIIILAIVLVQAAGKGMLVLPDDGTYRVLSISEHDGILYVVALVIYQRGEQMDWFEPALVAIPKDAAPKCPNLVTCPMELHVRRGRCFLIPALA